jgi:hypothetical protein
MGEESVGCEVGRSRSAAGEGVGSLGMAFRTLVFGWVL